MRGKSSRVVHARPSGTTTYQTVCGRYARAPGDVVKVEMGTEVGVTCTLCLKALRGPKTGKEQRVGEVRGT